MHIVRHVARTVMYAFLWAWAVLMVFPLLFMVYTSFKSNSAILNHPFALPTGLNFSNYVSAWFGSGGSGQTLGTNFINSVIVTGTTLLVLTTVATLAGYALARYKFPGNRFVYQLIVGCIAIPVDALLVPLYQMMNGWNLIDTLPAVILIYIAFALPFSVVIMRSYFESIPGVTEEAARMDGCNELMVFWHVGLPMSWGAVATVIIVNLVNIWSELFFATALLSNPASRTLPVAISLFSQNLYSSSYGLLFAGLAMATVPLLAVYFVFQKQIVKGVALGAVK